MEFRIQDALKNLIPGITLIIVVSSVWLINNPELYKIKTPDLVKDLSAIFAVIFLALVYLLGYFIDIVASFLERKILYNLFKKPSYFLLNNLNKNYMMARKEDILEHLCQKKRVAVPTFVKCDIASQLFNIANELKDNNPSAIIKEKVAEYYNAYVFSRNLMGAIFISIIISAWKGMVYDDSNSLQMLFPLFIILVISCYRWRNRGYYYSRQVLFASNY